jgi:hypothetical protein
MTPEIAKRIQRAQMSMESLCEYCSKGHEFKTIDYSVSEDGFIVHPSLFPDGSFKECPRNPLNGSLGRVLD